MLVRKNFHLKRPGPLSKLLSRSVHLTDKINFFFSLSFFFYKSKIPTRQSREPKLQDTIFNQTDHNEVDFEGMTHVPVFVRLYHLLLSTNIVTGIPSHCIGLQKTK